MPVHGLRLTSHSLNEDAMLCYGFEQDSVFRSSFQKCNDSSYHNVSPPPAGHVAGKSRLDAIDSCGSVA